MILRIFSVLAVAMLFIGLMFVNTSPANAATVQSGFVPISVQAAQQKKAGNCDGPAAGYFGEFQSYFFQSSSNIQGTTPLTCWNDGQIRNKCINISGYETFGFTLNYVEANTTSPWQVYHKSDCSTASLGVPAHGQVILPTGWNGTAVHGLVRKAATG